MRLILRVVVLACAALGVKTIYDKLSGRSDELKETGSRVVDRAGAAAQNIRSRAGDAARNVAGNARASADDVRQTAFDSAQDVKQAAAHIKDTPTT